MGYTKNLVLIIWCMIATYGTNADPRVDPLVESKVGLIKGLTASDGDYSMFLGIPYASVNASNPFGHSIPHPGFENTFNAFEESVVCPQIEEYNSTLAGSLDCLRLNVYVPNTASSSNPRPVMVWIHGGGFQAGSGGRYSYGPKFLVRHDVIVVTFNYRLGPYGFLCLDIPEVPGNQGLKDQLTALRWIKNNIGAFGGDAKKITIFGESAGGTSVDYHFVYTDEDLFHNVILQSGTSLAPIGVTESDPSVALKLAEQLGFLTNNLYDALEFLSKADTNLVVSVASSLMLIPCVEKEFENVERFIAVQSINMNIRNAKKVPILIGFNSNEFGAFYGLMSAQNMEPLDLFSGLGDYFNFDGEYLNEMEEIVRHFYIGDEDINDNVMQNVNDYSSDFNFYHSTRRSIDKYIEHGAKTIYHYVFSYEGGRNFYKTQNNITLAGALHADELSYLFEVGMLDDTPSNEDQLMIDRITTLWTNFAKFSNPIPETTDLLPVEWPVVTKDILYYLDIDAELSVKTRPFHHRMAFWDLFFRLNNKFLKGLQQD